MAPPTDVSTDVDERYGEPGAGPTPWPEAERLLADAELYWLTTIRPDGRPHTAPLLGVWRDDGLHMCTGAGERKARNLDHDGRVTVTTGRNDWAAGTDVVVEGEAVRVTDATTLEVLAAAWEDKYGPAWRFDVGDDAFTTSDGSALVFRIRPVTAFAFAKQPHSQTRYRFA